MIRNLFALMVLLSGLCVSTIGCGGRSEPTVVVPDDSVVAPEMDPNYDPTGGGDDE